MQSFQRKLWIGTWPKKKKKKGKKRGKKKLKWWSFYCSDFKFSLHVCLFSIMEPLSLFWIACTSPLYTAIFCNILYRLFFLASTERMMRVEGREALDIFWFDSLSNFFLLKGLCCTTMSNLSLLFEKVFVHILDFSLISCLCPPLWLQATSLSTFSHQTPQVPAWASTTQP